MVRTIQKRKSRILLVTIDRFGVHFSPRRSRPNIREIHTILIYFQSTSLTDTSIIFDSRMIDWCYKFNLNEEKHDRFVWEIPCTNTFGGLNGKSVGMLISSVKI